MGEIYRIFTKQNQAFMVRAKNTYKHWYKGLITVWFTIFARI